MQKIELIPGIHSSVLGFGCAPILGSVGASTARKALDCAMDHGINHLDLARSYGYGEAEAFIGNMMKGKRHQLVIASKFGIRANWKASLMKPLKPMIRTLKKQLNKPGHHTAAPSINAVSVADRFHDRIEINATEMRASLEKSLKALRTDHLDYFFIHEPHATVLHIDEVLDTASQLKKEGKIRAFGLAYMQSQAPLHTSYLDRFDILQFNNSPGIENYEALKQSRASQPNLFFSPLKGGLPTLSAADKLKTLHKDFPSSVILCSMFREEHIKNNCNLFN